LLIIVIDCFKLIFFYKFLNAKIKMEMILCGRN
jgi:hypothetical protein